VNPNPRLENLKPFEAGQSGNPNGRPKGRKNIRTMLMELLSAQDPQGEWAKSVSGQLIRKAFRDNSLRALVEIMDRIEGKTDKTPLIDNSTHYHQTTVIQKIRAVLDGTADEPRANRLESAIQE